MATFAERIKELRESKPLTQQELAEALAKAIGATQAQISMYESGDQDPTASRIISIAAALDVDPGELLK